MMFMHACKLPNSLIPSHSCEQKTEKEIVAFVCIVTSYKHQLICALRLMINEKMAKRKISVVSKN